MGAVALADLAQPGVLSDPTPFADFLTYVLKPDPLEPDTIADALNMLSNARKSIGQKDTSANLSVTVGFSDQGWARLFPDRPRPSELAPFKERQEADRRFPSTPGDVFIMVKSSRMDLNYQASKHLTFGLAPIASLIDDVQGFVYLDDRDLIDFVDGTENPAGTARVDTVLVAAEGPDRGGSYLTVQKYTHRTTQWDALATHEQEGVIGRTKFDDIEIPDAAKQPFAHNVRSKVTIDGTEMKMYRQNRPFGNALERGTMFVGFCASPSTIEKSLDRMIHADEDGAYDHLLDFVDAVTGTNYFIPPQSLLDDYA